MDLHEIVSTYKKVARELGKTPTRREVESHGKISKRQIHKHGHNELCRKAGLEPNTNTHKVNPVEMESRPPKIFCFDLELLPIIARVWRLYDVNVGLNQIKEDWSVLSWAGKFLDEKKVHYADTRNKKDVRDDEEIVRELHKHLSQADMVLGHNSDRFDVKKINTRFIKYGLDPVQFSKKIDTLKIARKYFKFTSNKLDFLASFLGKTPKRKSKQFHGQELWNECEAGNLKAFKEMEKYNKQDILTTIEVFDVLKAWDESLNFQAYHGQYVCVCGGKDFYRDGFRYNKQSAYQLYRCRSCGKVHSGKENLIDKETRKDFAR